MKNVQINVIAAIGKANSPIYGIYPRISPYHYKKLGSLPKYTNHVLNAYVKHTAPIIPAISKVNATPLADKAKNPKSPLCLVIISRSLLF